MLRFQSIVPSLLTVIAGASSCYLSFGEDATSIEVLSLLILMAIVSSPLIAAWRENRNNQFSDDAESQRETQYAGPSDLTSLVLSLVSVGLLALCLVFPVRWPAALAFGLAMVNLSLKVSTRTPLRDLFVALVAMISIWPIAPELVARSETRVEAYLSRLVGDRLDSQEILNYPEGSVVQTLKGDVPMTGSTGSLNGIRLGVLAGCAVGLLMSRGPVHVMILSLSGLFWGIIINGFWAYGRALVLNEVSGLEALWGKSLVALLGGFILVLSTDQLLLVLGLLNPLMWIRRERKRAAFETNMGDSSQTDPETETEQAMKVPPVAFWILGALALVIASLDLVQVLELQKSHRKVEEQWKSFAAKAEPQPWPDRLGRWVRSNAELLGVPPEFSHQKRSSIVPATFVLNNRVVRVCWIGPASGWVDRFQDYVLKGWKLGNVRISQKSVASKPFLVAELSKPTGEKAVLIYSMSSLKDSSSIEPSIRNLSRVAWWHFLQSLFLKGNPKNTYYMTEICLESYSLPKENENQILDEIVTNALAQPLPVELRDSE